MCCCINLCCKDFCCIAGIYDGADTDRQFLNIHIHVQYITQLFYVLNLPAFLYVNKRNDIREPNIVLCLAVQFLSLGLFEKKKKKKDFIEQDQLSNHIAA